MDDIVARIRHDLDERASTISVAPITTRRNLRRIRMRRTVLGVATVAAVVAVAALSTTAVNALRKVEPIPPAGRGPSSAESCPDQWTAQNDDEDAMAICTPPGWTFRGHEVSGPDWPPVLFAVGSWDFPTGGECAPSEALSSIPPGGAFFYVFEQDHGSAADFPSRPAHLRLGRVEGPFECLGVKAYHLSFQESGRYITIFAALGRIAYTSKDIKQEVTTSLDSLRVGPRAPTADESASPDASAKYPECPVLLEPGHGARREVKRIVRRWARDSLPDPSVTGERIRASRAQGEPQGGCYPRKIPYREETWHRTWVATVEWRFPKGSAGAGSASLASSIVFVGRTEQGWVVYYQFH